MSILFVAGAMLFMEWRLALVTFLAVPVIVPLSTSNRISACTRLASFTSGLVAEMPSNGARQPSISCLSSAFASSQRSIRLGPASVRELWIGYPVSAEWMLR